MKVWYKADLRPCSWGSLWAASPGVFVFLVAAILKLLRYNPPPVTGFPLNQAIEPVELEDLPCTAQQALRALIDACGQHSFRLAYCFSTENLGDAESYLASMLHDSGRIRAAAYWSRLGKNIESGCTFTTRLENGAVYSTSNLRLGVDLPPDMHAFSHPGASTEEIFSRHQQLLKRLGAEAAVALTPEQLPEELNEQVRRVHAYLLACGAIKPMTEAEIDRLTIVTAELVPEPSGNPFRPPLAGELATPRRRSVWGAMFGGACYGGLLGGLAGLLFRQPVPAPVNPNRAELLWFIAKFYGWFILPALAGAFLGWLSWRRAKRRETAATSSS